MTPSDLAAIVSLAALGLAIGVGYARILNARDRKRRWSGLGIPFETLSRSDADAVLDLIERQHQRGRAVRMARWAASPD